MHALLAMIAKLRTWWAALVRRLAGGDTPAPVAAPTPLPSLVAAPEPPVALAASLAAAVAASPEHVREDMSVSTASVAPASEPGPAHGDALRADAGEALSVRRFFARVAAAVPGGLTVDFTDWQTARVERYFMALGASDRTPQRGPALAEDVAMKRAFDDFEWD